MNILEEAKQLGFSPYDGDTKGCFAGLTILSVDVQLRIVDSVEVWRVWICDSESSVLLEHEFESCETAMFAASTLAKAIRDINDQINGPSSEVPN